MQNFRQFVRAAISGDLGRATILYREVVDDFCLAVKVETSSADWKTEIKENLVLLRHRGTLVLTVEVQRVDMIGINVEGEPETYYFDDPDRLEKHLVTFGRSHRGMFT